MRLWSIHPIYLDQKGLGALWREGLLAQAVLLGHTNGYKNHPQLNRFTVNSIGQYLCHIYQEAARRNYNFDKTLIKTIRDTQPITITTDQKLYEMTHLIAKLEKRLKPEQLVDWWTANNNMPIALHPMFVEKPGKIAGWEKYR